MNIPTMTIDDIQMKSIPWGKFLKVLVLLNSHTK